jgi:hypothetical protein
MTWETTPDPPSDTPVGEDEVDVLRLDWESHAVAGDVHSAVVVEGAHIHSSDSNSPSHNFAVGSIAAEEENTARKTPQETVVDERVLIPPSLLHPCVSFRLVGD